MPGRRRRLMDACIGRIFWCGLALQLALGGMLARGSDATSAKPKVDCPKALMSKIRDDRPLYSADQPDENSALTHFLISARKWPVDGLLPHAKPNLTAQQLLEADMNRYRGEILHVEGRLTALREIPAGPELEKEGIRTLFEGRVIEPSISSVPTTVVFIELPQELKSNVQAAVACDGFFFKRHQYQDEDAVAKLAGVVVARSVRLTDASIDSPGTTRPIVRKPPPKTAEGPDPSMDCPREWLEHIEDDQPVWRVNRVDNEDEYNAYNYFVLHARKFPLELLANHSDRRLTFRRLFDEGRAEHRGAIVHVAGRLKRLESIGSNDNLRADGVDDLYEAWIFDAAYFSNPTCVVISELPPGLKPANDINGVWVECDGYFFKRYKYVAPTSTRLAPLVIGRGVVVTQWPTPSSEGKWFIPLLLGLAFFMIAVAIVMHRYFKKGDRWVRRRLDVAQTANPFVDDIGSPPINRSEQPSRN